MDSKLWPSNRRLSKVSSKLVQPHMRSNVHWLVGLKLKLATTFSWLSRNKVERAFRSVVGTGYKGDRLVQICVASYVRDHGLAKIELDCNIRAWTKAWEGMVNQVQGS